MEGVFLEILNMSISASWLILAVIIIRALLSKAPKGFRYILWVLVAVRLVCPFTLESALSLIPSAETIPEDIIHSDAPQIHTGIGALDETINPIISENFSPMIPNDSLSEGQDAENLGVSENEGVIGDTGSIETPVTVMQMVVAIAVGVWCIGILAMLIYTIVSYMQLWKKVKVSVRIQDNVWISDEIRSPFILGIIRPRIYLPSHIEKEQMSYIIAHEKEHLRCLDYVWKPLGFLILTVHWFNPLVWIAYVLLCRDIELACDERVIRTMDATDKRNYSEVLLACSSPRHFISACPVAFGEIGIKERIKKILTYKKPAVWIIGIAVIVCVIVAICFMTNPKAADIPAEDEEEPVTSIDEGYKAAYTKHLNEFRKEHKEAAESMRGGWVYIDGDEIPELAIGKIGEMHLYTYKDGKIYQLMNDWAFLDAANTGYSYLLKQNAIFNLSITGAGRYVYLHFWKINEACELEEYYTEDLWYQYVTDENGGSSTIRYFYGENQISEEEFKGYIIGGNFKIDSEPEGYKDIWRYPKKIEELLDELSY